MNGEDDIAVIDQQEDIENLGYPVTVTDDFQSNLQLYIGTGKPENDAASLHALRNAYHDLKIRYNEQTAKVHSMKQAIKDMEAQRIQSTNRPFSMNTTSALAGAAGAGNQIASGAGEANPQLRANLGYADSLQRQILRLKNTSAGREKEMERKYSDLYTKYKRLEADVNTLQLRNRKTTAELEKSTNLLKDREMFIEQLSDRKNLLEKKVGVQSAESFSEESRLQEKHLMGIMEYQTKYIDELKEKVQEQNSIINKQLDMIRTLCRNQKEAEAAASRNSDYHIPDSASARQPDGESLLPLNILEQHGAGARPRQTGALTISAQTHLQNTMGSPPSSSRQQYVPNPLNTQMYTPESLADVEARRQNNVMVHQNFADARISRGPVMVQLPVPAQQSHDAPDSPVLNRSPKMSSPKVPVNPSDSSHSIAQYLDSESHHKLRLEDASVLPDTIYQPSSDRRQGLLYENDQRLQVLRLEDEKSTLNNTIYRNAAEPGPYTGLTRLEDRRTGVLYPPLPSSQENNYENIKVFLPPTQEQSNGDYANVSAIMRSSDQSNGSNAQKCPVCNKNFLTKPIDEFQQHVLDCMDGNEEEGTQTLQNVSQGENGRECPMCTAVFPGGLPQEEFERHVQEHFGEDPMMERFEVLQA